MTDERMKTSLEIQYCKGFQGTESFSEKILYQFDALYNG
jgi:hypothetical protein